MTAGDHTTRFEELLPAYALGALEGEELWELEEHLASSCPVCQAALARWRHDLEALAAASPPVAPAAAIRRRLLAKIRPRSQQERSAAFGWRALLWPAVAAAALLVLVWGAWLWMGLQREIERLTAERVELQNRLAAVSAELDQVRFQVARTAAAVEIVASPDVSATALAGLGSNPEARGRTYTSSLAGGALFYAYDLRQLPAGKTYQLWFIVAGEPASAGVFGVDDAGRGALYVEAPIPTERVQAWAVTIEPEGGVPQPTGEMVLKG